MGKASSVLLESRSVLSNNLTHGASLAPCQWGAEGNKYYCSLPEETAEDVR
jgi:hypothetical protein